MNCPACGERLPKRSRGHPRLSKKALLLYVLAGLVAFGSIPAWALGFDDRLTGYLFGLAGFGIALVASRLPKLRSLRCGACRWQAKRQLKPR